MSDIEKKVEEPVAAPETAIPAVVEPAAAVETAPVVTEPATTETSAEVPSTEEPSTEVEAPVEAEEVKEIAPISEGHLGYKAPGLLK